MRTTCTKMLQRFFLPSVEFSMLASLYADCPIEVAWSDGWSGHVSNTVFVK